LVDLVEEPFDECAIWILAETDWVVAISSGWNVRPRYFPANCRAARQRQRQQAPKKEARSKGESGQVFQQNRV
jgi:hypothetical protein